MTPRLSDSEHISIEDAAAWARGLSADEYDNGEDDGGWLGEMERSRRTGRHRSRHVPLR